MKTVLAMKKYWILLFATVAALVSCGRYIPDPLDVSISVGSGAFSFNLDATYPTISEARKQGWEEGDAVFVFFSGVAAPKHLKMTYSNSVWTIAEYDGATQSPGALGLKNGDKGTMRAVFLPFGSNATVSGSDGSFTFSTTYYAYYLTATLDYTVAENKVSGAFSMTIPDGYVLFFIEDKEAVDGGYTLGIDAVIPVGVASIAADGSIVETSDKEAKDDLPGYAYGSSVEKGYLFSGKLVSEYNYGLKDRGFCYYFARTKTSDGSRADYFEKRENALESHDAVKLPGHDSERWITVGTNVTVYIDELGTWYTCNYGATAPEELGTKLNWADAVASGTLPSEYVFWTVFASAERTWMGIHGKEGWVVKSIYGNGNGFIFLPKTDEDESTYWSSTEHNEDCAGCLVLYGDDGCSPDVDYHKSHEWAVRFLQN